VCSGVAAEMRSVFGMGDSVKEGAVASGRGGAGEGGVGSEECMSGGGIDVWEFVCGRVVNGDGA
jgi:hypothetical protein